VTISTINGVLVNKDDTYMGVNYASRVMALASNITSSGYFWFPENEKTKGMISTLDSDDIDTDNFDNLILRLPYNIKSCDSVRVIGLGRVVAYDTDFSWEYKDAFDNLITVSGVDVYPHYVIDGWPTNTDYYHNIVGVPVIVNCKEYREWLVLDPDSSNGASEHQKNTLYYKRGENKIYNLKICNGKADGIGEHLPSDPIYYKRVAGSGDSWGQPEYQTLNPMLNYYVPHCDLYFDGLIELKNNSPKKRTTIYSQDENVASGYNMLSNMQNYINSMENSEKASVYRFNSIDDLPDVGELYNGKIISQLVCNAYYDKIEATLYFSDNVVKKSEYVNADAGIDLFAIQTEKAYDRFKNYSQTIWFCRTESEADDSINSYGVYEMYDNKVSTYKPMLSQTFMNYALDFLDVTKQNEAKIPAEVLMKTGTYEEQERSIAVEQSTKSIKNSIFISFKTLNNSIANYRRSLKNTATTLDVENFDIEPMAFMLPELNGQFKEIIFKVNNDTVRDSEIGYPLIDNTNFDNFNELIYIKDDEYYHDPAETINTTIQIDYKNKNIEDVVYAKSIQQSSLFFDTKYEDHSFTVRYLSGEIAGTITSSYAIKHSNYKYEVRSVFVRDDFTINQTYDVLFYVTEAPDVKSLIKIKCLVIEESPTEKAFVYWVAITK
jgi:hypothetical protein